MEPGVEEALRVVASILLPHRRMVERDFRRRLKQAGYSKGEIDALGDITPAAAVSSWDKVRLAGRRLALLKCQSDRAMRALMHYEEAAGPIFERSESADLRLIRQRVQCSLLLEVSAASAAVQEQEFRILHNLLQAEASATDASSFRETAAECLRTGFGACVCAVGRLPKPRAATRTIVQFPFLPNRSERLVDPSWAGRSGCVWSVPAGKFVLQLGFDAPRRIYPREAELLDLIGQRLESALRCFGVEERQRAISLQVMDVEELERLRITRELHDDTAQSLALIRLQLEMAETGPLVSEAVREALAETREVTEHAIVSIRRLLSDLSPAVLKQLGLAAAARQLAVRLRADAQVRVRVQLGPLPELSSRISLTIYRILQEAFLNIARHARASNVLLSISATATQIRIAIEDDGIGFDPDQVARKPRCYGLTGIRLRVMLLGGLMSIRCRTPVGGTHLSLDNSPHRGIP